MAHRRMFALTIIDSDAFLDMPLSTQALYFHLGMRADDDGFVNNPKRLQRSIEATDDDLKLLIAKEFIIPFESGIIAIKDWKIHNYIRNDRYKETVYREEKILLRITENGSYTLGIPSGIPNDNQVVYQMETQVRLGKDRLGQVSEGKDILGEKSQKKYGEYNNVILSDSEFEKLKNEFPSDYQDRIENLSSYMASEGKTYSNHLATIRRWAKNEKQQPQKQKSSSQSTGNPFLDLLQDDFEIYEGVTELT